VQLQSSGLQHASCATAGQASHLAVTHSITCDPAAATRQLAFLQLPSQLAHKCVLLVQQGKESRLLTYEERLEAAERRRLEGNELYKQGRLDDAISKYRCVGLGL
jgi:hypothetical protein